MEISINYGAVIAAAVSNMILGFLWYGPLFGKTWIKWIKLTSKEMEEAKKRGMGKTYAMSLVGALVMAFVLGHFANVWLAATVMEAWQLAFWIWLGFIATTFLGSVLWEAKPFKLYLLNIFYYLVALFVMALIFTFWMW